MPDSLAVTNSGNRILVGDTTGNFHVFAAPSWMYLGIIRTGTTEDLRWTAIAPDESAIATVTRAGTIQIVRAP